MKLICQVKLFFISLVLVVPFSYAAANRYDSRVVIPERVNPQDELTELIDTLKQIGKKRDHGALKKYVSHDFFLARNFGRAIDMNTSGPDKFINTFSLDDDLLPEAYKGTGWMLLENVLSANSFQKVNGSICAPANAKPVNGERPDEFWLSWGYVNGSNVYVREKPSLDAKPVTSLSYEVVEPVSGRMGDSVEGLAGDGLWIRVNTAEGFQGYMYSAYFKNFQQSQICFRKQNREWKISGFVGGGE